MSELKVETPRLIICELQENMAAAVYLNSLNEELNKYVNDEVFASEEEALQMIKKLRTCYGSKQGPFVYGLLLRNNLQNIGYVQLIRLNDNDWEVGYHIAAKHRRQGYAVEALNAFLKFWKWELAYANIWGICHPDNIASHKVLLSCGFELTESTIMEFQGKLQEVKKFRWITEKPET